MEKGLYGERRGGIQRKETSHTERYERNNTRKAFLCTTKSEEVKVILLLSKLTEVKSMSY